MVSLRCIATKFMSGPAGFPLNRAEFGLVFALPLYEDSAELGLRKTATQNVPGKRNNHAKTRKALQLSLTVHR